MPSASGGILSPLSPWVWKRTCQFPALVAWLVRGSFIVTGTATGCLMAGLPIRLILGPGYHYWNSFRASLQIALVLSVLITIFSVVYANFKSKLETTQLQLTEKEVERRRH